MKAPAFQFYPADFLVGTADMTNEETGVYIRLLSHQWAKGPLDTSKLSRLVGTEVPSAVMEKFQVENGRMWNTRLEDERAKQAKFRDDQSKKGKAGADARWNSSGHLPAIGQTMAEPMPRLSSGQWPNDGSSSSSSSSEEKKTSSKLRFTDDDLSLAQEMFSLIRGLNPNAKEPDLDKWANDFRLMRERDGTDRTVEGIRALMCWALGHSFWKSNVLSPDALRKQWDRLMIQRKEQHDPRSNSIRPSTAKWQGDDDDFAHLTIPASPPSTGRAECELEARST